MRPTEQQTWVSQLLDELCVDCGFCLPPTERARLVATPPQSIDAFTDAVFVAERLDPKRVDKDLWREVRMRVARRFRADVATAVLQDIGPLLDELSMLGVTIKESRYDEQHFGNYYVDFDTPGTAFRIVRDRGQHIIDASVDQVKVLGLFRAIDSREDLREAALTYISAATKPDPSGTTK